MSEKYHEPYLCGGLFFTQLLRFVDQSTTANDRLRSINEPKSEPNVLKALISTYWMSTAIVNEGSLSTNSTYFKKCEKNIERFTKFNDPDRRKDFNKDIVGGTFLSLKYMKMFVESFLTLETDVQKERLIKIFLKIIQEDSSILPEQEFYVAGNKTPITKSNLCTLKTIHIDTFLLGIWHFIIMKRCDKNDSVLAQKTSEAINAKYNNWLEEYDLPEGISIELYMPQKNAEKINRHIEDNSDSEFSDENKDKDVNSPQPVINQFVKEQYVLPPNQPFIKANYIGNINYYGNTEEDNDRN